MSFDVNETGIATGKPVRLYLFERGVMRWRYCTADRDVQFGGQTWRAAAISDDGIRQTGESSADSIKITGPADLEVADQYRITPPSAEVTFTILDYHWGDTLGRVRFVGSVSDVNWPSLDRCELTVNAMSKSMEMTGLRLVWQRNCPYTVGDRNCLVNLELFRVNGNLSAVTATTVSASVLSGYGDGHFSGGFVEWAIPGGELERRGIDVHTGGTATLIGLASGLSVGMPVSFFPGCTGTIAVCDTKFSNKEKYGGVPHLAGKSPFDGAPIF